jgi:hypothetical protein
LRAKRRAPAQLPGQCFDCPQSGHTDVMFHSFDIVMDDAIIETEEFEKFGQKPVPVGDASGELLAGFS